MSEETHPYRGYLIRLTWQEPQWHADLLAERHGLPEPPAIGRVGDRDRDAALEKAKGCIDRLLADGSRQGGHQP